MFTAVVSKMWRRVFVALLPIFGKLSLLLFFFFGVMKTIYISGMLGTRNWLRKKICNMLILITKIYQSQYGDESALILIITCHRLKITTGIYWVQVLYYRLLHPLRWGVVLWLSCTGFSCQAYMQEFVNALVEQHSRWKL